MNLDDKLAALWPKFGPSSRLGRIIFTVFWCEVGLYVLLAAISPHYPDAATGQVIAFPGRHSSFYVNRPTALFIVIMIFQALVTGLPLFAIWMASHPTGPDETSPADLPPDER